MNPFNKSKGNSSSMTPKKPTPLYTNEQIKNFTINFEKTYEINGNNKPFKISDFFGNNNSKKPKSPFAAPSAASRSAPSHAPISLMIQKVAEAHGISPSDLSPELRDIIDNEFREKESTTLNKDNNKYDNNFNINKNNNNNFIDTTSEEIYYQDYVPLNLLTSVFTRNSIFSGVLRYIFLKSGKKMNTKEIEFLTKSHREGTDPKNVLDYQSEAKYGTGQSQSNPFFGVRFKRIQIRPSAYSIQSSFDRNDSDLLVTFLFQAKKNSSENSELTSKNNNNNWVTLDEQCNTTRLARAQANDIFFVDTSEYFSEFRILQNGKSNAGNFAFELTAFEVHGDVQTLK